MPMQSCVCESVYLKVFIFSATSIQKSDRAIIWCLKIYLFLFENLLCFCCC